MFMGKQAPLLKILAKCPKPMRGCATLFHNCIPLPWWLLPPATLCLDELRGVNVRSGWQNWKEQWKKVCDFRELFPQPSNNFSVVGLKLHPERLSSVAKNWLPLAITSGQGAMRDTQKWPVRIYTVIFQYVQLSFLASHLPILSGICMPNNLYKGHNWTSIQKICGVFYYRPEMRRDR